MRIAALAFGLALGSVWAGFADDGPAATTTTLATSIEGAFTTKPPVFTATVATESSIPATGTVEFVADGVTFGEAPVFTRGGQRIAVMGGASLSVGFRTIAARYSGDESHLPSDSASLVQRMSYGDYSTRDLVLNINRSSTATVVNEAALTAGFISIQDAQGRLLATVAFDGLPDAYNLYGGRWIFPTAIDASGNVAGRYAQSGDAFHAFVERGSLFTDLGTLGGAMSQVLACNDAGDVVGSSTTATGATHGFLRRTGPLIDLGTLGGQTSAAMAISSSGIVAGYADLPGGEHHAAYYTSSWHDLGTLGGRSSAAVATNDAGQIAGTSLIAGDRDMHAFRWQDGQLTDLSGSDGRPTQAAKMNDAGQVVGWTTAPGGGSPSLDAPARNAFLYSGSLDVLGTLHGGTSQAFDISNAGLIVGVSDGRAFVSNGSGGLRDLGTLGGPTSIALAINDQGVIVGQADLNAPGPGGSGVHHAVAWMPIPRYDLVVAPASGAVDRTTVLSATLKASRVPAAGQRIDFELDGVALGSATTDPSGKAVLPGVSLAGFAVGTHAGVVRATHAFSFTIATADLVVTPDHAPVASNDAYEVSGPLSVPAPGVLANDIDADGDALAAVLVSGPAHGTLTLAADGSFAYVPDGDPGPVGQGDTFTYRTVAAGLSSNVATVSLVGLIAPLFGGVVSGAPVTIDDSSNGKTRPRVSGDLITWSTSFPYEVHYYDLANGQNAVIPRPGDRWHDFSAEIDRGRIAFARLDDVNFISSELVFDVASGQSTDTRAIPEGGPTIGGNTVATTDHNIFGDVNVYAVDLATLRFTFLGPYVFGAPGVLPRVSPAGDAVVWAVTPFQGHSQMFMARRMAGAWSTSSTPDMAGLQFMDADTDGGWTVYTTAPLSDPVTTRIHLRSVGNPSDDRVFDGLPGAQARPSIDRGVISFDGGPGAFADVFVYVIATNTLYQVTDTTDVNETSSDVSVLPNGDIRVTWLEGSSGNVVRALTFTPGIE